MTKDLIKWLALANETSANVTQAKAWSGLISPIADEHYAKKLMQKPSTEQAEQIQQHIKRIIHHDQVIRNHQGGWPKLPYMAVRGEQESKVVSKSFKTSEAKAQKSHTASAVDWGSEQVKRQNSRVRLIRVHPLMERWQVILQRAMSSGMAQQLLAISANTILCHILNFLKFWIHF